MTPHLILKSFPGNQTGIGPTQQFVEGEVADLSEHLAAVVVPAGLAEPCIPTSASPSAEEKAIETVPANKARKLSLKKKADKDDSETETPSE